MICKRCGLDLPEDRFGLTKARGKAYVRKVCKSCHNGTKPHVSKGFSAVTLPITVADPDPLDSVEITVDPLEIAKLEHAKATEKRDLKKEHTALLEENARLQRELDVTRRIQPPSSPTIYAPAPKTQGDAIACCAATDWHVEEPVERHKVHGLNEYNLETAERRARAFFKNSLKLTNMMARESRIDTLFSFFGGDFFTNYIHDELKQINLLAPADAANFVLKLLSDGIHFWLRESSYKLVIDCMPGNHGRMSLKPQIQNAIETSLEAVVYNALAMQFAGNPRVEIRVATSKMMYRSFFEKFTMRLLHGDDVKFGGGVGGITIPIRKKLAAWNKARAADLTVMGHFHQLLDGGDFLVNGSLIGYGEFAQAIGANYEEPQQLFWLVHARHGGQKSVVAPIWLDD